MAVDPNDLSDNDIGQLATRIAALLIPQIDAPSRRLLDIKEVAERLHTSVRTVETQVALGEIPVVRIGAGRGVRRFDPAAVDAFVRRQTRTL